MAHSTLQFGRDYWSKPSFLCQCTLGVEPNLPYFGSCLLFKLNRSNFDLAKLMKGLEILPSPCCPSSSSFLVASYSSWSVNCKVLRLKTTVFCSAKDAEVINTLPFDGHLVFCNNLGNGSSIKLFHKKCCSFP